MQQTQQQRKTFAGNRSFEEIRRAVIKKGWFWDQSRYDGGSDYVTFGFRSGREDILVVYSLFSGKFIVRHNGKIITERSTEMDSVKWYADLLDFVYLPKTEKPDAAAGSLRQAKEPDMATKKAKPVAKKPVKKPAKKK